MGLGCVLTIINIQYCTVQPTIQSVTTQMSRHNSQDTAPQPSAPTGAGPAVTDLATGNLPDRNAQSEPIDLPPLLRMPPPDRNVESLIDFVQQLYRDYTWLYQLVLLLLRNQSAHSSVSNTAVAVVPSLAADNTSSAAIVPVASHPTVTERRMPYKAITREFMTEMRVRKNVGVNRAWSAVVAEEDDEVLIRTVFTEMVRTKPRIAALVSEAPGQTRECISKCIESYRRKVPVTRTVPEPSRQASTGNPAPPARRSSRHPTTESKRRNASRKQKKIERWRRALTADMLAMHPGLTESVLPEIVTSEYTTEAPSNATSAGELSNAEAAGPRTYRRRVRKSWMSVQGRQMTSDIERASRKGRRPYSNKAPRLSPHDVILRPRTGFRENFHALSSSIQRRWVSAAFKDSFEEAVVDVSANAPSLEPETWGATPDYVTVEDTENEADDELNENESDNGDDEDE